MTTFNFTPSAHKNAGIAIEWGICEHFHIERTAHDHVAYNKGSDVECGDLHMSVKSARFSLISSSLCCGETTFDGIWNVYAENVHSNRFVYGTKDGKAYMMNLDEFKSFVYEFCGLQTESEKNGGGVKIRCGHETKKMLKWLEDRA